MPIYSSTNSQEATELIPYWLGFIVRTTKRNREEKKYKCAIGGEYLVATAKDE